LSLRSRLAAVTGGRALPRLAHLAVKDASETQYLRALQRFVEALDASGSVVRDASAVDRFAAEVIAIWALDDNEGIHWGNLLEASLLHFVPEIKGDLPLLSRSLKGWRKHQPERQRAPLSRTCVGALAHWMCEYGHFEPAIITILSYDALLREQDWTRLRRDDITDDGKDVALQLGSFARGEPCKTGYDQGVTILNDAARLFARAARDARAPGELVFYTTEDDYRHIFKQAVQSLRLPQPENGLEWVPHCLRHGGASEFHRLQGARAQDIKLRGRWDKDKSVARYTKVHQLVALDSKLSAAVKLRSTRFWASPQMCFKHTK